MFGFMASQKVVSALQTTVIGAAFDGASDYMEITTDGINSPTGTISFWFYPRTIGYAQSLFAMEANGNTNGSFIAYLTDATLVMRLENATNTNVTGTYITTETFPINQWHHVILSWDIPNDNIHFVGNGVFLSSIARVSTDPVGTDTLMAIGANLVSTRSQRFFGDYALVYFDNVYYDITTQSNIDKFYNASNPLSVFGDTGTVPSGSTPKVFFKEFTDFATNAGTYSDGVVTGALAEGETLP